MLKASKRCNYGGWRIQQVNGFLFILGGIGISSLKAGGMG